ncbi:MAG: hypothetical protein JO250_18380 [Armatimonadetes bacterium]|nr:hypothetical protein [Armatimonadota bacterium]
MAKSKARETANEETAVTEMTQEERDRAFLRRAEADPLASRAEIRAAMERMADPPRTNMAGAGENALLEALMPGNRVKQECMRREIARVRREVAGPHPSALEALVAERVAACWAHLQVTEALYTSFLTMGTAAGSLPHHRRMEIAQRRYLSAIKALAQVRRLQLPAVQVSADQVNIGQTQNIAHGQNIAEKQVNVGGGNTQSP